MRGLRTSYSAVWGTGGKQWLKEFCFFFLPLLLLLLFSQKYQFHQSFDNYETCQLIVRIHQMCHKRQEMRSRILKLDGFQKSLTITAINHPGTSIFGCRKFCREQKNARKKAHAEKRCHALNAKGWCSIVRIDSRVTEVVVTQSLGDTARPLAMMKLHRGLHPDRGRPGAQAQPCNLLGILGSMLTLLREVSLHFQEDTTSPVHDILRAPLKWGLQEKTVQPKDVLH